MSPPRYAELRAASAFSFLEAASAPEDLARRAAELDLPALALIDRNGVYGAPRLHAAAREAGLRALVGAEVALGAPEAPSEPKERNSAPLPRLTLLVETRAGYRNLCRLLTSAALGKPKGEARATWDEIAAHAEGLHCLAGGADDPVARALLGDGDRGGGRGQGRRLPGISSSACARSSPGASTSSSSATTCAPKSTATPPSSTWPRACDCRRWRPTACATPGQRTSRSRTCSR